jgi:hypothetical protein
MKHISILGFLFLFNINLFSQNELLKPEKTAAITLGFLQGGGSLIGLDIEKMLDKHVAVQVGLGLVGFGAAINYHPQGSIRSSFVSLQYFQQGFDSGFTQNGIGPSFVFRAKKIFSCQFGFARILSRGPAWPSNAGRPAVIATYAIGVYLPL